MVCESCVRQAGGIVTQNFSQFEDLLMLAQRLHGKQINGNRLAALSGAGFEAVGMADNIQSDDFTLRMARLAPATVDNIAVMLREKAWTPWWRLKIPWISIPAADDEAHVAAVRHLAEDPHVDAVVVGLDPLSPAMRTLAECESGATISTIRAASRPRCPAWPRPWTSRWWAWWTAAGCTIPWWSGFRPAAWPCSAHRTGPSGHWPCISKGACMRRRCGIEACFQVI